MFLIIVLLLIFLFPSVFVPFFGVLILLDNWHDFNVKHGLKDFRGVVTEKGAKVNDIVFKVFANALGVAVLIAVLLWIG